METMDARLSVGLFNHPKIKKLIRRVGYEGPWRLIGLWLYARQHKPDGSLGVMNAEDIEIAVDWAGKPGDFVEALVQCRLLDLNGDTYELHDWEEHQPFAVGAQARRDSSRLAGMIRAHGEVKGREMFHAYQARRSEKTSDPLKKDERPASEPVSAAVAESPKTPAPSFLPSSTTNTTEKDLQPGKPAAPTTPAWEAYAEAYQRRHGCKPSRDAEANAQLKRLIGKVGADDAPAIAAHYVTNNDAYLIRERHPLGVLAKNAQKYRTDWLTGRQITGHQARQTERTASNPLARMAIEAVTQEALTHAK